MAEAEVNHFPFGAEGEDSDIHRRCAAQCMRPRSAPEIAWAFAGTDPTVAEQFHDADEVAVVLEQLEAGGMVKNLGSFEDGAEALKAQNKDRAVIDFQGDERAFAERAEHPQRFPHLGAADHYVMTKTAHAKLTGEAPGSEG